MQKFCKSFGIMTAILLGFNAVAAESPRTAYNVANSNPTTARSSSTVRMPTLPTMPGSSIGIITDDLPTNNGGGTINPPKPPVDPVDPTKPAECKDGGVKNTSYTSEMCMNDILQCINNGALPNGLNDMFNPDLRESIVNGMGLCYQVVDKCLDVREDCKNIYGNAGDVWNDFNDKKVQPEYYNFVLRRTGLTPNQAENTCWLLDKNTYGASFNAVANDGVTTAEYAQRVGAYNLQNNGSLSKDNPMGAKVNDGNPGVDGQRGHYARWDATTAECHIRVAAYNKDKHITNNWLFGAIGDDRPAEVWQTAGSAFSCNKDLFGFNLMNNTKTTAVVGIGGGTLVGTGIGALAGHGERAFDCNNTGMRKELADQLRGNIDVVNANLGGIQISRNGAELTVAQCNAVVDLYDTYMTRKGQALDCDIEIANRQTITIDIEEEGNTSLSAAEIQQLTSDAVNSMSNLSMPPEMKQKMADCDYIKDMAFLDDTVLSGQDGNIGKSMLIGAGTGAAAGGLATAITAFVEKNNINCRVGDGLDTVGYGKSYSLGSLKDFYVKWNLNLPEVK